MVFHEPIFHFLLVLNSISLFRWIICLLKDALAAPTVGTHPQNCYRLSLQVFADLSLKLLCVNTRESSFWVTGCAAVFKEQPKLCSEMLYHCIFPHTTSEGHCWCRVWCHPCCRCSVSGLLEQVCNCRLNNYAYHWLSWTHFTVGDLRLEECT